VKPSNTVFIGLIILILGLPFFIRAGGKKGSHELDIANSTEVEEKLPEYEFRYHDYEECTALLENFAASFASLAKLYSIGKSATGKREIWCLEVGNQKTGPAEDKPAIYIDGNQHDNEVMGGEVTLYLAHFLLTRYEKDPDVTRLVNTRVVYIVQRADPDGAEAFITGKVDWDPDSLQAATDADGDGRKGEDGPEDIDGDGEILKMRIRDDEGEWTFYPADPRILIKKEKGDAGPFFRLLDEGIDNDGDASINEDPPKTRFISNRNYPAFWASADAVFRGQGDYPLQEHNSRLIVDFILSKPHISQVESFHTTSGIHVRPLSTRPDSDIPRQDLQDYEAISAKGMEITSYPAASLYHDFTKLKPELPPEKQTGVRHGVFIDWTYWHRGLFSITTELWSMEPFVNQSGWDDIPRERPLFAIPDNYRRPDVQASFMRWLDAHKEDPDLSGQGFIDWHPFDHPTLGEVEIGGLTRYWLRNPPPGPYFRKVAEDQARFVVLRGLTTPLVKIVDITANSVSEDDRVWEIEATAANEGYLDTSMEQSRRTGIAKEDRLRIILPDKAATKNPEIVSFAFMRGTRGSSFKSYYRGRWTVEAPAGTEVTVEIRSEKGGTDRRRITLISTR